MVDGISTETLSVVGHKSPGHVSKSEREPEKSKLTDRRNWKFEKCIKRFTPLTYRQDHDIIEFVTLRIVTLMWDILYQLPQKKKKRIYFLRIE